MTEQQNLQDILDEELKKFPLYNSKWGVMVKKLKNKKGFFINYPSLYSEYYKNNCWYDITKFIMHIVNDVCHIPLFYVEEKKQRLGYGRKMYECIENFCKKTGCKAIHVHGAVHDAASFFEAMGFEEISEEDEKIHVKKL